MASDVRPWLFSECNYDYVKNADIRVAALPLGATEPHNLHLPYGTDVYEAMTIGERVCAEAFRRGAAVTLLPTIPFGVQTNMRNLPLAMNINPAWPQCTRGDRTNPASRLEKEEEDVLIRKHRLSGKPK